jgi:hypothetical protein
MRISTGSRMYSDNGETPTKPSNGDASARRPLTSSRWTRRSTCSTAAGRPVPMISTRSSGFRHRWPGPSHDCTGAEPRAADERRMGHQPRGRGMGHPPFGGASTAHARDRLMTNPAPPRKPQTARDSAPRPTWRSCRRRTGGVMPVAGGGLVGSCGRCWRATRDGDADAARPRRPGPCPAVRPRAAPAHCVARASR